MAGPVARVARWSIGPAVTAPIWSLGVVGAEQRRASVHEPSLPIRDQMKGSFLRLAAVALIVPAILALSGLASRLGKMRSSWVEVVQTSADLSQRLTHLPEVRFATAKVPRGGSRHRR
jgi:hypothetical protein